jgi:sialate O-acetylesterase
MYAARILFESHAMKSIVVLMLAVAVARAEVQLHPLFSDHAVLQRGTAAAVYGTADAGEPVSFQLSKPDGSSTGSKQPVVAKADGSWAFNLPADLTPGTGYSLTVSGKGNSVTLKDLAVGDVWICSGQSNMGMAVHGCLDAEATTAASANPKLRLFQLKLKASPEPLTDRKDLGHLTKWAVAGPENVGTFSCVAYFFGAALQKHLPGDVPIGLIQTAWGGTPGEAWVSKAALNAEPALKYYHDKLPAAIAAYDPAKAEENFKEAMAKWEAAAAKAKAAGMPEPRKPIKAPDPKTSQGSASNLFNSMILPLVRYSIRGAIWYQGEANGSRAAEYRTLLPTLVKDWRAQWGSEFPFLVVQLPGWTAGNAEGAAWAELREAQALTAKTLPKVGLAVTLDVGDKDDVHPKNKKPVGERLAKVALVLEYGEKVLSSGPTYRSLTVEGDKAVVSFDSIGSGLMMKGETLTGFAVAGNDGVYHPAEAAIRGDTVELKSAKVAKPATVRYGWKNWPEANLFNKEGFPAAPFRTDDQPLTTAPKK